MRLTFVTPHRRRTSGGVYAIERWAELLAATDEVHLAVLKGDPGVLRSGTAARAAAPWDALPASDALLVPADSSAVGELASLAPRHGRVVILFQGYGAPANPVVSENLARGLPVVATARWLVRDARRRGCPARRVPYGLARDTFFAGPPPAARAPSVAMLTHTQDWKGGDDGVAALEAVRAVTGARIRLFGTAAPPAGWEFVEAPTRAGVGALMREAAVFACASWEEGFGMPGLEALACGAALATTDTKGGRDYAHHDATALVSAPRDPDALAANIVRLLDDVPLRERLAAGAAPVVDAFPSWRTSASRLRRALDRLLDS